MMYTIATREKLWSLNEFIELDDRKEFLPLIMVIKAITLQFESHNYLKIALIRDLHCTFKCTQGRNVSITRYVQQFLANVQTSTAFRGSCAFLCIITRDYAIWGFSKMNLPTTEEGGKYTERPNGGTQQDLHG